MPEASGVLTFGRLQITGARARRAPRRAHEEEPAPGQPTAGRGESGAWRLGSELRVRQFSAPDHYVRQQPEVAVSAIKEVNFLSYPGEAKAREQPWLRFPVTSLDEYRALFPEGRVGVDFSASCFQSPVAIDRIHRFLPDAQLLIRCVTP